MAGVLAAAGAVHLCAVLVGPVSGPVGGSVSVVLGVAALVGAVVLVAGRRPGALLAAAAVGALGVAAFLLPRVLPLPGFGDALASWSDPWLFGGFLLDALVVRLAVFTLRRTQRAGDPRSGRTA